MLADICTVLEIPVRRQSKVPISSQDTGKQQELSHTLVVST